MVDMGREGLCLSVRLSIQAGETLSWMCGPGPPHWASPALGAQALRGGCRAGLWALGCAAGPPAAACCTCAPQGCLQEGCTARDGEEEEESCPHKWDEVTRAHHQPRGAAGSRTAFCAEGHAHQLACLHLRHVLWEGTSVLSILALQTGHDALLHPYVVPADAGILAAAPVPRTVPLHTEELPHGLLHAGPPAPCSPSLPHLPLLPNPGDKKDTPALSLRVPSVTPPGLRAWPKAQPLPDGHSIPCVGWMSHPEGTPHSPLRPQGNKGDGSAWKRR